MTKFRVGLSMFMVALGCSANSGGQGTSVSGGVVDDTTTETPTTDSATTTTTATTTAGSAEGTGSNTEGADDTTSADDTPVTTDPGSTTDSADTSGTTDGDSSSGEPPPPPVSYPPCMNAGDCPAPYTACWPPFEFGTPSFCTHTCNNAGECPEGHSGGATPVCEAPPGYDPSCVLDCGTGDCPDGMDCWDIFGDGSFLRCVRF